MEANPPAKGKGRTLKSIGLFVLFLTVVTAISFALKPLPSEPRAIFLHPDGQLSLGSRNGEKFAPSVIESWPLTEGQPMSNHIILDALPETPASKWFETICQLASRGYASYQLRSAGEVMNFHVAMMMQITYSTRTEPHWVDLRPTGGEKPELREMFDVVVIGDDATTCGQILAAARPHQTLGKSLLITSTTDSLGFRRAQTEDLDHEPSKLSLADRVKSLFRP